MDNRLLWSHRHELAPGESLVVHRSDFGAPFGLGAYRWRERRGELGGLVWAFEGIVTAHVAGRRWLLTPQHAAWLPARAAGEVVANTAARAMYVEWSQVRPGRRARRVAVPVMTAALLRELSDRRDTDGARSLWRSVVAGLVPMHDDGLRGARTDRPQDRRDRRRPDGRPV